ncbi:MAG: HlyC/CorC family transporter [Marinilabiliaceae bacterium]|nr:HlyC/CorC family transporter [Marinilabiliaceae bacterium]
MDQFSIIIITLILSAFFSGCEMAFISSNKLLLELNRKKNPFLSKIIDLFLKHPGIYLSTMLIGNNVALVVYGLEMGNMLEPLISLITVSQSLILLIQTLISTLIILITAEFLPKTLFRINPIFILNTLAIPIAFFYSLLYPVSKLTISISNILLRFLFNTHHTDESTNPVLGRIDLNHLLSKHHEQEVKHEDITQEVKLLKNALDFSSIKIKECSIPRTEIEAIEIHDSLELLKTKFIQTGLSKILVYKDTIDNIIGYIHVSDMFKHPKTLKNIIYPISVVPETMTANKVLEIFTKEHKSIALVVDEFGGTSGIVTMEDILEEIFGEIDDEHDVVDIIMTKTTENEYLFSGRAEVDAINEKFGLNIPYSDDYETIAGLILYHNESIPKEGEVIEIETFTITIKTASNNRIDLVKLAINNQN